MSILFWLCGGLLVYTYGAYPLALALLVPVVRKLRRAHRTEEQHYPSVSVLLSAYNEEKHITDRLANILAQDYPNTKLQVLVGSDGSTDATDSCVRACPDPRVCLFDFLERGGKPSVLKRLVPHATGELLVFTDANTQWQPDALKKLARHFADPRIGGVCGRLVFQGKDVRTDESPYWKLETFLKTNESALDSCLGANGAIYAIRRSAWPEIPDNTFVDDFVIGMRVREQGLRVLYDTEAVATEELPVTVGHEMTRRIRIGAGDFQALVLCWRSLLPWRGLYTWSFWSHKVLRWFGPFFMIGALVANYFLLPAPFFLVTMMLQLAFYALALLGVIVRRKFILFSAPHYFAVINLALLLGFFRYLTGTQRAAWRRTAR
ncbi:MAG: glycosyltransferase family 2 protein [Verrucomicrobia bacterium]|nr:glycosyltransferase family 2 protein [Verrucomicrobiota bacterium]